MHHLCVSLKEIFCFQSGPCKDRCLNSCSLIHQDENPGSVKVSSNILTDLNGLESNLKSNNKASLFGTLVPPVICATHGVCWYLNMNKIFIDMFYVCLHMHCSWMNKSSFQDLNPFVWSQITNQGSDFHHFYSIFLKHPMDQFRNASCILQLAHK